MLDLASGNSSENKAVFGFDTYALQLQDIDPSLFNGQTFTVNLGSADDAVESQGNIQESLKTFDMVAQILEKYTASVQLPNDFLDSVQGCASDGSSFDLNQLRLSYSVFLTDVLFQSRQNQFDIGSIIVATRLGCADNTSLRNPIRVIFRTVKQVQLYRKYAVDIIVVVVAVK